LIVDFADPISPWDLAATVSRSAAAYVRGPPNRRRTPDSELHAAKSFVETLETR
jgi:hypothetical protein